MKSIFLGIIILFTVLNIKAQNIKVGAGLTRSNFHGQADLNLFHSDMFSQDLFWETSTFFEIHAGYSLTVGKRIQYNPTIAYSQLGVHYHFPDDKDAGYRIRIDHVRLDNFIDFKILPRLSFGISPTVYFIFNARYKPNIAYNTDPERSAYIQLEGFFLDELQRWVFAMGYRLKYQVHPRIELYTSFFNDITPMGALVINKSENILNYSFSLGAVYQLTKN